MDVALRTGLETRKIVSRLLKQSASGEGLAMSLLRRTVHTYMRSSVSGAYSLSHNSQKMGGKQHKMHA